MEAHKNSTNQPSKPVRHPIRKRHCSKGKTPMEDLTTIVEDHEANIQNLNLLCGKMEQRIKDMEDILMRSNITDRSPKVVENEIQFQKDEGVDVVKKQQKSADSLRKQKKMFCALGLNPDTVRF
ncbi:hypothetical protein sscle_15g104930 [Sclerotinia sclerotiorum 1980 UF-70]|uniref:Uncharacterized protein n=1 Tax=Sclerotinia sclerotiorum (strain ATCC 18683 / 1980 / Ss-1) TaxID=665079 RepID=A0A1D9QMA5_SCLS1|nr:hypothetical protein sscle_15g104930 [Sclerotinia sclerotiorum 1980 UF-70]